MHYTLTMRDDVDGGVCVVPSDDAFAGDDGVLRCPAASAVAVADGLTGIGTWSPHPSLEVSGRPVAVATSDAARTVVAAVNGGTPVDAALALAGVRAQDLLTAA